MDHPALSSESAIPLPRSLAWCLSADLATRPAKHWAASSHSMFSAPWGLQAFLRANLWIQAPMGLQIKSSLSMTAGKSGVGVTSFPLLTCHVTMHSCLQILGAHHIAGTHGCYSAGPSPEPPQRDQEIGPRSHSGFVIELA